MKIKKYQNSIQPLYEWESDSKKDSVLKDNMFGHYSKYPNAVVKKQDGGTFWSKLANSMKDAAMMRRDTRAGIPGFNEIVRKDINSSDPTKSEAAQQNLYKIVKANNAGMALGAGMLAGGKSLLGVTANSAGVSAAATSLDYAWDKSSGKDFNWNDAAMNVALSALGGGTSKILTKGASKVIPKFKSAMNALSKTSNIAPNGTSIVGLLSHNNVATEPVSGGASAYYDVWDYKSHPTLYSE